MPDERVCVAGASAGGAGERAAARGGGGEQGGGRGGAALQAAGPGLHVALAAPAATAGGGGAHHAISDGDVLRSVSRGLAGELARGERGAFAGEGSAGFARG